MLDSGRQKRFDKTWEMKGLSRWWHFQLIENIAKHY